jgi:hypothetical protein
MQSQGSTSRSSDRERRSLLLYALFRWESAAVIGLTLILVVLIPDPFQGILAFWRWWIWLVLGGSAEALILLTTLFDPEARTQVKSSRLRTQYNPKSIVDLDLRQQMRGILDLREQMEMMLQRTRNRQTRSLLRTIAEDTDPWIGAMHRLARHLSDYRDHTTLHQNQRSLPSVIQALKKRLAQTTDNQAKAQLEGEIDDKRVWLEQLERLGELEKVASLQLEADRDALETIYTQMQLLAARGSDGPRVRHLRSSVADRTRALAELEQEIVKRYEQVSERA